MKKIVRSLNKDGLARFRRFVEGLSSHESAEIPVELIEDADLLVSVNGYAEINDEKIFPSRLDAGKYLKEQLDQLDASEEDNCGMWAWMSLVYFPQLCPLNRSGKFKPGKVYGYIPSNTYTEYYRHKLLGPYTLFKLHGEYAGSLLSNPMYKVGEINEQIASRQTIVSNKEMMKAIHALYYDYERATFKRGATTRNKAGTVDRFWRVKEQLDLTHDFFSMEHDEILNILPSEFDRWNVGTPKSV